MKTTRRETDSFSGLILQDIFKKSRFFLKRSGMKFLKNNQRKENQNDAIDTIGSDFFTARLF